MVWLFKTKIAISITLPIILGVAVSSCQQPTASDLNAVTGASNASTATTALSLTPSAAGPPDVISSVSGNAQTAVNGSQLSNQLTVRVTDVSGKPVPNVTVTFAPGIGGGLIVTQTTVVTDSSGFAAATAILGSTVGTQTFTATMPSGSIPSVTFTHSATSVASQLKIFALAGTTPIGTTSLMVGDTFSLRTVLVSSTGAFIKEIAATWWIAGTLTSSNLAITGGNPSKYAVFSPSATGFGTINALIDDATVITQNNVTSTTTVTGLITVSLALVPDTLSIVSGNAQTGQVGTNLAQNLVVKVVNAGATPVPGADITFAVASGGGQIVSAQPVTTDSNGLASCIVKLGGLVGTGHSFTATMAAGTTRQVIFTATATHGPAAALSFYTQPSIANAGTAFSQQPVVEVRDQYGNRVTSDSSSTVTLSLNTGTGTLGGSLTANVSAGLATFTNVSYSVGESGVKIAAASSVGGVSSAVSSAFDVGTIIAAAQCLADGNGWQTIDGGCKNTSTGLVWSAVSASTILWAAQVWDSATSGSEAPEAWEVDRGITTDRTGSVSFYADNNAAGYCHSLVESGLSDWRMPTYSEMSTAQTNNAAAALKSASTVTLSGTASSSVYILAGRLGDYPTISGAWGSYTASVAVYNARCVRQPAPTKLLVSQQISGGSLGLGVNVGFNSQPKIRIADNTNSTTTYSTVPVTLTVTNGTGQLCKTNGSTGVTDSCATSQTVNAVAGVATFSQLAYNKAETVTLTASSPDLASVALNAVTINQTYPNAACKTVGGVWINASGGCKDTTTGIIYSAMGPSLTWNDFVWDQNSVGANAGSADADDNGRTNEYWGSNHGADPDASSVDYCHDLQQSGQTDWMLPPNGRGDVRTNELANKQMATYTNLFNSVSIGNGFWTSTVSSPSTNAIYSWSLGAGPYAKTNTTYAYCIRRDNPTALAFVLQPAVNSATAGSGVIWSQQPVVHVRDADGAGPLAFDSSSITLTVAPASDGTGGTGKLIRYSGSGLSSRRVTTEATSYTVNATNGAYTFSYLAYNKPGEKFRLAATATSTWRGQTFNLGPVYSDDLNIPVLLASSACNAASGWTSAGGGCKRDAANIVWSNIVAGGVSWYDLVWDSTKIGSDPPDQYDYGATNDYDTDYLPGPSGGDDNIGNDVCHRLILNGYRDWRPPRYNETNSDMLNGASVAIQSWANYMWVARSINDTTGYYKNATAATWYGNVAKAEGTAEFSNIRCVRVPQGGGDPYQY